MAFAIVCPCGAHTLSPCLTPILAVVFFILVNTNHLLHGRTWLLVIGTNEHSDWKLRMVYFFIVLWRFSGVVSLPDRFPARG